MCIYTYSYRLNHNGTIAVRLIRPKTLRYCASTAGCLKRSQPLFQMFLEYFHYGKFHRHYVHF